MKNHKEWLSGRLTAHRSSLLFPAEVLHLAGRLTFVTLPNIHGDSQHPPPNHTPTPTTITPFSLLNHWIFVSSFLPQNDHLVCVLKKRTPRPGLRIAAVSPAQRITTAGSFPLIGKRPPRHPTTRTCTHTQARTHTSPTRTCSAVFSSDNDSLRWEE